jgi:hypothetical protein
MNHTTSSAAKLFEAVATAAKSVGNGKLHSDAMGRAAQCRGQTPQGDPLDNIFRDLFSSTRGR